MKNLKKFFIFFIVVCVSIFTFLCISMEVYRNWSISSFPYMKFCKALGYDPNTERLCNDTQGIYQLIQERFPLEITTREEVQVVLDEFYLNTSTSYLTNNLVVDYKIAPSLLSEGIVSFYFDENEQLIEIRFYD